MRASLASFFENTNMMVNFTILGTKLNFGNNYLFSHDKICAIVEFEMLNGFINNLTSRIFVVCERRLFGHKNFSLCDYNCIYFKFSSLEKQSSSVKFFNYLFKIFIFYILLTLLHFNK